MPNGTATIMEISVTFNVPAIKGKIPNNGSFPEKGSHCVPKRKSVIDTRLKNSNVSKISVKTMPNVVNIEIRAAENNRVGIAFSTIFFVL